MANKTLVPEDQTRRRSSSIIMDAYWRTSSTQYSYSISMPMASLTLRYGIRVLTATGWSHGLPGQLQFISLGLVMMLRFVTIRLLWSVAMALQVGM